MKIVEHEAKRLGFNPTLVLNAPFDTDERRKFARRLTTGQRIESERLKGVVLIKEGQVFSHDPVHGDCHLIPEQGVFLTVTDEHKAEIVSSVTLVFSLCDLMPQAITSRSVPIILL